MARMIHQNQYTSFPKKSDIIIESPNNRRIVFLGIQGKPGLKFRLNSSATINAELMIGATGVFELDLSNTDAFIDVITIAYDSILDNYLNKAKNSGKNYIIVDYITDDYDDIENEGGEN